MQKMTSSEGDPNTKNKDGKEYNWLKHRQAWVPFSPDECKKNPDYEEMSKDKVSFATKISRMLAEEESDSE